MSHPAGPPGRTPEQRADAARTAVRARAVRARLRDDLANGRLTLADVFAAAAGDDEAAQAIASMRVRVLLESLPGVGERRADRAMTEVRIAESRRVRGLGATQRAALIARFAAGGRAS